MGTSSGSSDDDGAAESAGRSDGGPVAPRPRRALRWIGIAAAGLLALIALAFAGVWAVAANLSHPFVKSRVQALARDQAGLDIDYEATAFSWTRGLTARRLRVLQPPKFRSAAATFIDLSELELKLNALAWARGSRTIDALRMGTLTVTVVRDASGASTLSELFPDTPESTTEPRTAGKWSHSLDDLPELHITRVDLERARAELLELNGPRITLGNLRLHGAVTLAPGDLDGTDLQLTGAPPLRLERREHDSMQYAVLGLRARVWAESPRALSLEAESTLEDQTLWPAWTAPRELLRLATRLKLDPAKGTTSIACPTLRVLGDAAKATADVQLLDGDALRLRADGRVDIALPRLPVPVPGISLAALTLWLDAKQLSLDGDRLAGSVEWQGGLEELALAEPRAKSAVRGVQLRGRGSFDGPVGHFTASAQITDGAWTAAAAHTRIASLALDVEGKTEREAQGQRVAADAKLRLASLQRTAADAPAMDLSELALDSRIAGTVAELARKQVPILVAQLAVQRVTARDAQQRTVVEPLTALFEGRQLATDEASPSGLRGAAEVTLELPSVRTWEGGSSPKRPSLAVRDLHLRARMPLGLEQVHGSLAIESLRAQDRTLESTQIQFELKEPLAFPPDAPWSHASAHIAGKLGDFRSGPHRGSIDELRLDTERLNRQRYRVELASTASSLHASGQPVPGPITAELHADAAPELGALTLTAAVRGNEGTLVDLDVATELARGDRLKYRARVAASKLDAVAGLIAALAPGAAGLNVAGTTLEARAHGDLGGVLRGRAGAMPLLAPQPLRTVRGEQSLEVELAGLDLRAPDQALAIPKLTLEARSNHGAEGAGSAHATLKASTLHYDRAGKSIHLEGLDHTLEARYGRAPTDGLVDVRAQLALASATQSWLPNYPIGALRMAARVELARLRSILVRELSLNNPLAGTELSARGALELRARPGASELTLAGREALQLEGSLSQALEPFERLGYAEHARGTLKVPFRLESGGLLGYRLFAAIEAQQISYTGRDSAFGVEDLNGAIPVVEEFALLPGAGPVVSAGPRTSPFAAARFIDVHPFVTGANYLTAESVWMRGIAPFGPLAANVRIERSDFLIDQIQAGFNSGQIVGQVRASYRDGDPIVRIRLNGTGLRAADGEVFDANAALTFVPNTLTLDGKLQLVRGSRAHLLAVLDVVDPYHESVGANRVRAALRFGYPKFVRFHLHDGAIDTKVELGGLAELVRIDEIKATPLGPIMQRYVAPALAIYPRPTSAELVAQTERPETR